MNLRRRMLRRGRFEIMLACAGLVIALTASASPRTPLTVQLEVDPLPVRGQLFDVHATVGCATDLTDVTAFVTLPEGCEFVGGALSWNGDLAGGQEEVFSARCRFLREGNYIVEAQAFRPLPNGNQWGDVAAFALNVGTTRSQLGFVHSEGFPVGRAERSDTAPVQSRELPSTPARIESAVSPASVLPDDLPEEGLRGTVTASGYFFYYDSDDNNVPAKYATVTLWDADTFSADDYLGSDLTDENGYWEIGPVDNSDGEGGTQDLYAKLATVTSRREVQSYVGLTYEWLTDTSLDVPDGAHSVGAYSLGNGQETEGSMWIFQTMYDAWSYPPSDPGTCVVAWAPGTNWGTQYWNWPFGIVWVSDIYKDAPDVIVHEMAHRYMENAYGNMPLTDCPEDHFIHRTSGQVCAWAEGWADFFPLAVYNDPVFNWSGNVWIDLETPTSSSPEWDDGDDVEGRVAGALWDIFDSVDEGLDNAHMGFDEIWDVLESQNDNTFAEYWDAWDAAGHPTHDPVACLYWNTIDYNTDPAISGLPNRELCQDASLNNTIDLWSYSSDPESSGSELSFAVYDVTNTNVGVAIDSDRYIDISPVAGWSGTSTVEIQVFDGIEFDRDSFVVTVNPKPSAPGRPTVTPNPACSGTDVTVSWSSVSGATDYKVYLDGDEVCDPNASTSCVVPAVAGSYTIKAHNDCGWSGASPGRTLTVSTAPSAPGRPTVTPNPACSGTDVTVSWSTVSGATDYKVYLDGDEVCDPDASTSCVVPAVAGSYTVKAHNECGWSGAGLGRTLVAEGPVGGAPTSCAASTDQCDGINLTWGWSGSNQTGFKIKRDGMLVHTGTAPAERSWLDAQCTAGTHGYTIYGYNTCGDGSSCGPNGTRLAAVTGAPTDCVASTDLCDGINLSWSWSGSNQTGFKIERDGTLVYAGTDPTERSWLDEDCLDGAHAYTIYGYNADCGEGPSCGSSGIRVAPVSGTPSGCTASTDLCDGISLSWNWSGSNQTGFKIERDGTLAHAGTAPAERSWLDTQCAAGTHNYVIYGYNACGDGSSCSASGTRLQGVEATPNNCLASDDSCEGIQIAWDWYASGHDGFRVRRDGELVHEGVEPGERSWFDSECTAGPHSYTIAGYVGECDDGPTCDVLGERLSAPSASPASCTATEGLCDGIRVAWEWASDGASGFKVERDGVLQHTGTSGDEREWFDADCSVGSHSYIITAYNTCGDGPFCSTTGERQLLLEESPEECVASEDLCTGIQLSWSWWGAGQDGFRVYRDGIEVSLGTDPGQRAWLDEDCGTGAHDYAVHAYTTACGDGPACGVSGTRLIEEVVVLSPNGGEMCLIGDYYTILWEPNPCIPLVDIELSRDGASGPWSTILDDAANDGTAEWPVEGPESATCRLRISDASDSDPVDLSNADFDITDSVCQPFSLVTGWTMVSMPAVPPDSSASAVLPGMPIYGYDSSTTQYYQASELSRGFGYWVGNTGPLEELDICGVPVATWSTLAGTGWEMIGSVIEPVPLSGLVDDPPGALVQDVLFGYNPTNYNYEVCDTIMPGRGYWVATQYPCLLTLSRSGAAHPRLPQSASSSEPSGRGDRLSWAMPLTVTSVPSGRSRTLTVALAPGASDGWDSGLDTPLPPPVPDTHAFEACLTIEDGLFARLLRDVRLEDDVASWSLDVATSDDGFRIVWDREDLPDGQLELVPPDGSPPLDMSLTDRYELAEPGSWRVEFTYSPGDGQDPEAGTDEIALVLRTPHPNPAAGTVFIAYELPSESHVKLRVYDVSGRLVRELEDTRRGAGSYVAVWDGRTQSGDEASSGVYLCTLIAGTQGTRTQQFVLLR